MIVSHRHRFIFFAVPRTATHSVRQALRPFLDEGDWEQQMLTARQSVPIAGLAALGHGHVSVRQAAAHLPPDIWRSYFRFGFVRNPFDRLASACSFLNRGNPRYRGRETAFMKRALVTPRFRRRVLVMPQTDLLAGDDGRVALDYVGRYEHLQEHFDDICGRLGLPAIVLPASNQSPHHACAGCYDAELTAVVADFYRRDFRELDYPAALPAPAGRTCS